MVGQDGQDLDLMVGLGFNLKQILIYPFKKKAAHMISLLYSLN